MWKTSLFCSAHLLGKHSAYWHFPRQLGILYGNFMFFLKRSVIPLQFLSTSFENSEINKWDFWKIFKGIAISKSIAEGICEWDCRINCKTNYQKKKSYDKTGFLFQKTVRKNLKGILKEISTKVVERSVEESPEKNLEAFPKTVDLIICWNLY